MRKSRLGDNISSILQKKLFLVMRLTCFLIVLLTFSVQASVYAQHERVNLEINSESLSNVLMKIKDQTGVRILYNENLLCFPEKC